MSQRVTAQHVASVRTYVTVFLVLIGFTILTVAVSKVNLGEFNFVAAITIAAIKASLVAWFFMHLNHATSLTRLAAVSGLAWLSILLTYTLSDYLSR